LLGFLLDLDFSFFLLYSYLGLLKKKTHTKLILDLFFIINIIQDVSIPTEVTDIDAVDDTGPSRKQRVKKKWSQIKKVIFFFLIEFKL
jgi:hypothetical protein